MGSSIKMSSNMRLNRIYINETYLTNSARETRKRILAKASLALGVSVLVVSVQMAAEGTVLVKLPTALDYTTKK